MSTIGTHYAFETYNCSHFVLDWYRENLDFHMDIPPEGEFSLAFIKYLRKRFTPNKGKIAYGDLAFMKTKDNRLHVGVFDGEYVIHNYSYGGNGQVQRTDKNLLCLSFKDITYWKYTDNEVHQSRSTGLLKR